jgi:hypothetical protein
MVGMDRRKLEEWTAAERAAQEAERLVQATFQDHRGNGGPAPTVQMQQLASRRRQAADTLFHALFEQASEPSAQNDASFGGAAQQAEH